MKTVLLIGGVPGTGKTTLGGYLERSHGFHHVDVEELPNHPGVWRSWRESPTEFLARLAGERIVVTWGFMPVQDDPLIADLLRGGAVFVWFDGNRVAARRAFNARGDVPEYLLDVQLDRIDRADSVGRFRPTVVNPFDQ